MGNISCDMPRCGLNHERNIGGMKSMYYGRSLEPANTITSLTAQEMLARDIVVKKGMEDGNEHGVAVSVATGEMVSQFTSGKPEAISVPKFDEPVIVHHNHPLGDGLSRNDIMALLTRSDIASVYAHGHDNQYSFASSRTTIDFVDADRITKSVSSISRIVLAELVDRKGAYLPNGASPYLFGMMLKDNGTLDEYRHNPPREIDNFIKMYEHDIRQIIKELM